jgi:hypothetical protein
MKPTRRFHQVLWLSTLLLGALACGGGGGGGGESFIVTGLWSTVATSEPGTPSPDSAQCNFIASTVGPLGPTTLNVVQQDGTATANELGSDLEFTGTVDTSNNSFILHSTTPIADTSGSCHVEVSVGLDFFNAGGNTADLNVAFGAVGSGSCPGVCTIVFNTTATRS